MKAVLHKSKFLSCYTVRYHRCYAPRYRLDVVGLLPLDAASYHTHPWRHIIQCFNVQHILQVFVEPDAMDVCVAALLYALLPQVSQVPWSDRKSHMQKKRHTFRCAFSLISDFLSSQAVSSQVLSAFMSLTTVFEMGTGGPSQLSPLNLSEFVL